MSSSIRVNKFTEFCIQKLQEWLRPRPTKVALLEAAILEFAKANGLSFNSLQQMYQQQEENGGGGDHRD